MKRIDPDRRSRHQRRPARWAGQAAKAVGLKGSTVEAKVHGRTPIQEEVAEYLRRLLACGNESIAHKVFAPIQAAVAGIEVPDLTPELECRAVEADEEEAIARAKWQSYRTPETLKAWRIALETAAGLALPLYLAVLARERVA